MSVLVTGAAGFIASHLIEALIERGEDIAGIDNFNDYYDPRLKRANAARLRKLADFPIYEADIRDADACRKIFAEHKPRIVVHLAARAGVRNSIQEPILYEDVNCRGTLNLLELSRDFGVERFVFGSSSSVYGGSADVPFREDAPVPFPISPYAATKRAGELYCYTYHHLYKMSIACLRFFTVYGPWGRPDMAVYKFARLIDQGKPIPVYGDGKSSRDYTFCKDIAQGITGAMDAKFDFEIFNLGESRVVPLDTMISLIENELGKKAVRETHPPQPGDVPITYADISKAKRMLGYNPSFPFEKGVHIFAEWYLNERPVFNDNNDKGR